MLVCVWRSVSQEKKKMVNEKKKEINVERSQMVYRCQMLMLLGSWRGLCIQISVEYPTDGEHL